ncbi:MAG: NAD-dependent deacylase [Betaproteobacteria bacterium]|nr:NAD-dependent deacylase [Betaproteobacteria bacterium]
MDLAGAARALGAARRVAVLTGAGISAESGVPTFRDAQTGLWARYRPEDLATPQAFAREPQLVWEWYTWRRELVARAQPNAGHRALVELAACVQHMTLISQNVDHLHELAGSRDVLKLHGSLFANIREDDRLPVADSDRTDDVPPRCRVTGQRVRPGVVWFGESLPADVLHAALEAAREADVFLSIGTSSAVEPAASLPFMASQRGATVIEINPDTTPLTGRCEYSLRGPAAEVLPVLVRHAFASVE